MEDITPRQQLMKLKKQRKLAIILLIVTIVVNIVYISALQSMIESNDVRDTIGFVLRIASICIVIDSVRKLLNCFTDIPKLLALNPDLREGEKRKNK